MSRERELLREIIECFRGVWSHSPEGRKYLAKCDAILAQPEAEPFGWWAEWNGDDSDLGNYIFTTDKDELDHEHVWLPLYTHEESMQPTLKYSEQKPEAEPIAWARDLDGTGSLHMCAKGDPDSIPLCASAQHPMTMPAPAAGETPDSDSEPPPEVRIWRWTGELCRYTEGVLMETLKHSEFLSSPGPAVVLYEDYLKLRAENERQRNALRAELEIERMRLAACGVVAISDTHESAKRSRDMLPEYRSASCDDVARRVDECMELRAENEQLAAHALAIEESVKRIKEKAAAEHKDHPFCPHCSPCRHGEKLAELTAENERLRKELESSK